MGVTVKIISGGEVTGAVDKPSENKTVDSALSVDKKPPLTDKIPEARESEKVPLFTAPSRVSPHRLGFGAVVIVQLILSALCFGVLWILSLTGGEEMRAFIGGLTGMLG